MATLRVTQTAGGTTNNETRLSRQDSAAIAIIVATGYSAGHVVVYLPPECIHEGTIMLSTAWLLDNWSTWVYPECAVEDVYYLRNYPTPDYPARGDD